MEDMFVTEQDAEEIFNIEQRRSQRTRAFFTVRALRKHPHEKTGLTLLFLRLVEHENITQLSL